MHGVDPTYIILNGKLFLVKKFWALFLFTSDLHRSVCTILSENHFWYNLFAKLDMSLNLKTIKKICWFCTVETVKQLNLLIAQESCNMEVVTKLQFLRGNLGRMRRVCYLLTSCFPCISKKVLESLTFHHKIFFFSSIKLSLWCIKKPKVTACVLMHGYKLIKEHNKK